MKNLNIILIALFSLSMTACVTPKTYVDPTFSEATYNDIKSVNEKYRTQIDVEFQRNGKPLKKVESEVRGHVERTLRATGVIQPEKNGSDVSIKVVVNNVADIGKSAAKGFGTGLTLGLAGSLVTDYYEITIDFNDGNGRSVTEKYKHALHTTIGNKSAPFENIQATTPSDGFGTVVEQTLLNFVKDMQMKGLLSFDSSKLYKRS